jgi:hypothetical protein
MYHVSVFTPSILPIYSLDQEYSIYATAICAIMSFYGNRGKKQHQNTALFGIAFHVMIFLSCPIIHAMELVKQLFNNN